MDSASNADAPQQQGRGSGSASVQPPSYSDSLSASHRAGSRSVFTQQPSELPLNAPLPSSAGTTSIFGPPPVGSLFGGGRPSQQPITGPTAATHFLSVDGSLHPRSPNSQPTTASSLFGSVNPANPISVPPSATAFSLLGNTNQLGLLSTSRTASTEAAVSRFREIFHPPTGNSVSAVTTNDGAVSNDTQRSHQTAPINLFPSLGPSSALPTSRSALGAQPSARYWSTRPATRIKTYPRVSDSSTPKPSVPVTLKLRPRPSPLSQADDGVPSSQTSVSASDGGRREPPTGSLSDGDHVSPADSTLSYLDPFAVADTEAVPAQHSAGAAKDHSITSQSSATLGDQEPIKKDKGRNVVQAVIAQTAERAAPEQALVVSFNASASARSLEACTTLFIISLAVCCFLLVTSTRFQLEFGKWEMKAEK